MRSSAEVRERLARLGWVTVKQVETDEVGGWAVHRLRCSRGPERAEVSVAFSLLELERAFDRAGYVRERVLEGWIALEREVTQDQSGGS